MAIVAPQSRHPYDMLMTHYARYFKHLRLVDGIHVLHGRLLLEAETPDGRYLCAEVGADPETIATLLRNWSGEAKRDNSVTPAEIGDDNGLEKLRDVIMNGPRRKRKPISVPTISRSILLRLLRRVSDDR